MPPSQRPAPKLPEWAEFMLKHFSPGQLQAGIDVALPTRVYKERRPREGERDYKIVQVTKRVAGTRIPASVISKFQRGVWTPRERTLSKLRKLYVRYSYQTLRAEGLNTEQARRFSTRPPDAVARTIKDYNDYIRTVAAEKGVDPLYIAWGFMNSTRKKGDWDSYIRSRGYTKLDTRPRAPMRRRVRKEPTDFSYIPYPSPTEIRRGQKRRRKKKRRKKGAR
jgi:hypothetical protein